MPFTKPDDMAPDETPAIVTNADGSVERKMVKPYWFGLKAPDGVNAAWGARAIFHRRVSSTTHRQKYNGKYRNVRKVVDVIDIDIPWDRQQMVGEEVERKRLSKWVNTYGMKWLEKQLKAEAVYPDHDHQVDSGLLFPGFRLQANPRASHGYLYIAAWSVM